MDIMKNIRETKIREVMSREVVWLNEDDPVEKAVNVLCSSEVSMLPVRNKKGLLSGQMVERDLLKIIINPSKMSPEEIMMEPLVALSFFPKSVKEAMRPINLELSPDDTVEYAAREMFRKQTTLAPVIDNGKLVGIITEDDLVRLLSEPIGKVSCTIVKIKPEEIKP
ncbi:MAG: CBS domain-containing protein [Candidatus Diapherotrites archaeon]|nr:CBS domain-containing protein [Candidatus Diapherotrites archaeon]